MKNRLSIMLVALLLTRSSELPTTALDSNDGPIFEEITKLIRPIVDCHVSKIIFDDEKLFVMLSGPGQSMPNGRLIEVLRREPSSKKVLFDLGADSGLAKENGVYHQNPELVARIRTDVFLINLVCGKDFPLRQDRPAEQGASGNVVLFFNGTKRFTNLSKLDGASGKYHRALRWFAEEGVVLIAEYDREDKIVPTGKKPTERPVCLKFSDLSFRSIEPFPNVKRWYELNADLSAKMEPNAKGGSGHLKWTILDRKHKAEVVFDFKPNGVERSGLLLFPFDNDLACASSKDIGTYLVDFDGVVRNRVSTEEAFGYDYEHNTLFLRSIKKDEDGEHRYWMANMNDFKATIKKRLR